MRQLAQRSRDDAKWWAEHAADQERMALRSRALEASCLASADSLDKWANDEATKEALRVAANHTTLYEIG